LKLAFGAFQGVAKQLIRDSFAIREGVEQRHRHAEFAKKRTELGRAHVIEGQVTLGDLDHAESGSRSRVKLFRKSASERDSGD
jgi:hypothetical protein